MTVQKIIKLSANENCYGCSLLAREAILKNYRDVHLYPELHPLALKEKLAVKYGVLVKNIVTGAGSVGIINALIQTFAGLDNEVLTFENSFIAYSQLSHIHNRLCHFAPLSDLSCNPENLLPSINDRTRLIFIANPNNPTGTIISHTQLQNFLAKIPGNIIVVIDEAYAEYVTDPLFPDSIELQRKYPNLVILHSFSKIYGLAGLRIGYAIAEESIAAKLTHCQIPFSLNYLSYNVAIAALDDTGFIDESARMNDEQRNYLVYELKRLGYNTIPSQSNFIYVWFDTDAEKEKMYDVLFRNGIIICNMKIFGQEKALRITVGAQEANNKIISLIT